MNFDTFNCEVCGHEMPNQSKIEYCPNCDASIIDQTIVGDISEEGMKPHRAKFAKQKEEWLKRLEAERNYECEVCETPFDYSQIKTCPTCNFEYPTTPRYRMNEDDKKSLEISILRAGRKWFKDLQKARPQILTRTANTVYDLERAIDEKATVINLMPNKYILTRTLNIDYPISFSGTGGIAEIISECDDIAINYSGNGQLHIVNVKFYNKHDKNSMILKVSKGSVDIQHCEFSIVADNGQSITSDDYQTKSKKFTELENHSDFFDSVIQFVYNYDIYYRNFVDVDKSVINEFQYIINDYGIIENTSTEIIQNCLEFNKMCEQNNQEFHGDSFRDYLLKKYEQPKIDLTQLKSNKKPTVELLNKITGYFNYNKLNYFGMSIGGTSQLEVAHNSFKNIPVALILKDENQSQIIENTFENNQQAIVISDQAQSTIKQNTIKNNQLGFFVIQNATPTIQQNTVQNNQIGFHVSDNANPKIENNLIQQNQQVGALFEGKSNGVFNDNLCKNNKGIGINLSGETTFTIQNNLIQANETVGIEINHKVTSKIIANLIDQNKTQGISIKNQAQPTIRENSILSSENAIILADESKALIEHNIISNHKDNAILLTQKSSATIEHNQIDSNKFGVKLQEESTATIRINQIVSNTKTGVILVGTTQAEIQGNQIRQNKSGIAFNDESKGTIIENQIQSNTAFGIQLNQKANVAIKHNQIRLNANGIALNDEATGQILNNQVQSNSGCNITLNENLTTTIEQNIVENAFSNFSKSSKDLMDKNSCRFEIIGEICALAGLARSKITDFDAIANSKEAMNAIANSKEAMNAIANSKEASFIYICCVLGFNPIEFTAFDSKFINEIVSKNLFEKINKNQLVLDILYQHAHKKRYQNSSWQDVLTGRNLIVRINCTKSGGTANHIRLEASAYLQTSTGINTQNGNNFTAGTLIHNHLFTINNRLYVHANCEFEFAYYPL